MIEYIFCFLSLQQGVALLMGGLLILPYLLDKMILQMINFSIYL
jgi:hypothetical protein